MGIKGQNFNDLFKLRGCPFCGQRVDLLSIGGTYAISKLTLHCRTCGMEMTLEIESRLLGDQVSVVDIWNRRADDGTNETAPRH